MNIAVCIKQTPDTTARIKIADDGKSVARDEMQWIINPYDEFAIEAALKLVEKHGGEVTIISLGPATADKTIREALAMGAHAAVRINVEQIPDDPKVTAKALTEVLKTDDYDLILLGRRAIDDDQAQIPQLIATALNLPCVTVVDKLEIDGENGVATREVEGGSQKVAFRLPAVIGANSKLNQPRYRSLKGIMQAKKKKIDVRETSLAEAQLIIEKMAYPPAKSAGKIFDTGVDAVPEVVRLLRDEAKVI